MQIFSFVKPWYLREKEKYSRVKPVLDATCIK